MPFDPQKVMDDPRWEGIRADPKKLNDAKSVLFDEWVKDDPYRASMYASQTPEMQGQLRQRYGQDLEQQYPRAFKVTSAPVDNVSAAGQKSSGARRFMADPALAAAQGVVDLPKTVLGLADVATKLSPTGISASLTRKTIEKATGSRMPEQITLSRAAEKMGVDFKTTEAFLNAYLSPEQKADNQAVSEAVGLWNKAKAIVSNPSTIVQGVARSFPTMMGGAGVARKLVSAIPQLSPLVAAAIGEGVMSGGSTAAQAIEESPGKTLSTKQAAVSVGSGLATGLLGVLGGKLANRLGLEDVDVLLAGGATSSQRMGILKKVLGGAFSEGALEEFPQSMQERIAANVNSERPPLEGVLESGLEGAIQGAIMGGGVQIAGRALEARADWKGRGVRDEGRGTQEALPPAMPQAPMEVEAEGPAVESEPPDALPAPPGVEPAQRPGMPVEPAAVPERVEPAAEAVAPAEGAVPAAVPPDNAGVPVVPAVLSVEPEGPPVRAATLAEAQPGSIIENVPLEELAVDADRFQYKLDKGALGSTDSLKGVKAWNRDIAGLILAWRDPADGKVYVVNGHNRRSKASELGVKALDVRLIRAENDVEARAIGALANIAEGKGTAVDAAKFIRDSGLPPERMEESGVSRVSRIMVDGEALSRLPDELFKRVVQKDWTVERGKAVAAAGEPAKQRTLAELIEQEEKRRGKSIPDDVVQELAQDVESAPVVETEDEDLWGKSVQQKSAAVDKAWLTAKVTREVSAQRSLFSKVAVANNAARLEQEGNRLEVDRNAERKTEAAQFLEVFKLLKRAQPISGILSNGAARIAGGENARKVTTETIAAVRDAVQEIIGGRRGAGVEGSASGAAVGQPAAAGVEAGAEAGARAERVGNESGAAPSGLPGEVREPSAVYQTAIMPRLKAVVDARPVGVQVKGQIDTLVSRGLYSKASALMTGVKAGVLTEEEAARRWDETVRGAQATLEKESRKRAERQRQGNATRQQEMFAGDQPAAQGEASGQLTLLEPGAAEEYVNGSGIKPEQAQGAAEELTRQWQGVSDASGTPYQLDLFGSTVDNGPGKAAVPSENAVEEALKHPENPDLWRRAFEETEGETVSSLLHQYVSRKLPAWNIRGAKINSPQDFAALLMALRSPLFETMKVAFLDTNNRVLESRVASMGGANSAPVDPKTLLGGVPEGATVVVIAHNHPGGDPNPSAEDVQITRQVRDVCESIGLPILDHVITDGATYYSFRESGIQTFSAETRAVPSPLKRSEHRGVPEMQEQAPWERVKRADLARIASPAFLAPIVKALRQGDAGFGHVIFVNTRNKMTAVSRFTVGDDAATIWPKIFREATKEGATAFLIDLPQESSFGNRWQLQNLIEFGKRADMELLDVATLDEQSLRESGQLDFSKSAPASAPGVTEEATPYGSGAGPDAGPGPAPAGETNEWPGGPLGDPAVPTTAIKVEDDPDFSVFPIELPEAVEFGRRLMGGIVPRVRKTMKDALGRFRYTSERPVGLDIRADTFALVQPEERMRLIKEAQAYAQEQAPDDPVESTRIAQERAAFLLDEARAKALKGNPLLASKVLWHELGHLDDYLPQHMIDGRGNILARIASFVRYAKNMLGATPANQDDVLTPAERRKLRSQAEKGAGKRPAADEQSDLAAWREEVSRLYKELVAEEAQSRGLVTRQELLEELQPLIAWWRGSGETMESYFEAPEEMYAEAVSALMNNPAAVMKRAPTFYRMFYAWYRNKPEVRREYNQIQDDIRKKRVVDQHAERIREVIRAGDANTVMVDAAKSTLTKTEMKDAVAWAFDRKFGPWQRRLQQIGESGEGALGALSDNLYKGSATELLAARVAQDVVGRLVSKNLGWEDLGVYGLYQRVRLERTDIANPTGLTPKRAGQLLEKMRTDLGQERFAAVEEAWLWYRTIIEQEVLAPARQAQIFGKELQEHLEQNVAYMTFSVTPERATDADADAFRQLLMQRFGSNEGAAIHRQIGTLRGVANPATSTLLKMSSLINLVYRERAKWEAMQAVLSDQNLAGEWRAADTAWDKNTNRRKILDSRSDRIGTLRVMHGGEVHAWYGPKAMVAAFDNINAVELGLLSRALRVFSFMPAQLKRLYTELNPGFWTRQYRRDIRRFNRTMPGTSRDWRAWVPGAAEVGELPVVGPRMIGRVPGVGGPFGRFAQRAGEAALSSIMGAPNEDAQTALRRGAWISRGEGYMGLRESEDAMVQHLTKRGIEVPVAEGSAGDLSRAERIMKAAGRALSVGQYYERKVKMAGMLWMDAMHPEMSEARKMAYVRTLSGSPDFLEKGAANQYIEFARLFYNPWKEGLRSEKRAWVGGGLIEGRKSEMAVNLMRYTVLPRLALLAAAVGAWKALAGRGRGPDDEEPGPGDLADMLQSIPLNDRRASWVVPLMWADRAQRKVAYLRLPLEENERMAVAVLDAMFDSAVRGVKYPITQAWNYLGGNVPGTNPMLSLAADWATFLRGGVPQDSFRGRPVLGDNDAGVRAWKRMGAHTWNQTLGSVVGRVGQRPAWAPKDTRIEAFLRLPFVQPTIGSFVRVSNQGRVERLMEYTRPMEEREKSMKASVDEAVGRARSGKQIDPAVQYMLARGAWADGQFPKGAPSDDDELARRAYVHLTGLLEKLDRAEMGPEAAALGRTGTRLQKRELMRKLIEEQGVNP